MDSELLKDNPLLFGHDPMTGIVSVEPAGHHIRIFRREGGLLSFRDEAFQPFILASSQSCLSRCGVPARIRRLEGPHHFRFQLLFDTWHSCLEARESLTRNQQEENRGSPPFFHFIPDVSHQYMLSTGRTMFKGIGFQELHILAVDIETLCSTGYEFSNPERDDDRIASIALADSTGYEEVLKGDRLSEPEMLRMLSERIRSLDPDVITGHNIFRFDLDYIGKRAARHGVRLDWGRNGSVPHVTGHSRLTIAERIVEYPRWDIYGRHIVDTYFLTELYDASVRTLEGHGLKQVARTFGVASPQRIMLDGQDIGNCFRSDPERLFTYNLQDARETLDVFRILAYPWILQTSIFPYSFQNCPLRGNATRINSLFLREYLRSARSIPLPPSNPEPFEGGHAEIFRRGVVRPVAHCDVTSLYPSVILSYRIHPANDELGVFLPLLEDLKRFRVQAKRIANEKERPDAAHYESLQQVFKLLINSFFGYLGSPRHNFSDPAAASEVTRLGRLTLKEMIGEIAREGGEPVEADTDGIYFVPPHGEIGMAESLVRRISGKLPEGIDVELDGTYQSMFAYKTKNYALLCGDGTVVIKGSGLKSRGLEKFLREFLSKAVSLLLEGKAPAIETLYGDYLKRLRDRSFDAAWIAHTETLNESPEAYLAKVRQGRRNPSAAFETAIASGLEYRAGDQVTYYVTGNRPDLPIHGNCRPVSSFMKNASDVNIPYYSRRLAQVKKRFDEFMPVQPGLFDIGDSA